jgi:hypothetical protein
MVSANTYHVPVALYSATPGWPLGASTGIERMNRKMARKASGTSCTKEPHAATTLEFIGAPPPAWRIGCGDRTILLDLSVTPIRRARSQCDRGCPSAAVEGGHRGSPSAPSDPPRSDRNVAVGRGDDLGRDLGERVDDCCSDFGRADRDSRCRMGFGPVDISRRRRRRIRSCCSAALAATRTRPVASRRRCYRRDGSAGTSPVLTSNLDDGLVVGLRLNPWRRRAEPRSDPVPTGIQYRPSRSTPWARVQSTSPASGIAKA